MFKSIKQSMAAKRLQGMTKPDMAYAVRRAAQLSGERKERFMRAVGLSE